MAFLPQSKTPDEWMTIPELFQKGSPLAFWPTMILGSGTYKASTTNKQT